MFGLSFLSPWFLLGVAAAAGPLLLHLFARENAPVTNLPTMRFVPRFPVHQTRRRRLQDLLLLVLRVTAVVLLAVTFARPFFERAAASPQSSLGIIAMDTSFSMAGEERQRAARRLARAALDEMPSGTRVALVAFDQEARQVVAPTASRRDIEAALEQVTAGFGSTSYAAALRGALDISEGLMARLVLISDGQRSGADAEALPVLPERLDVVMRTVSPPSRNLSLDTLERSAGQLVAVVRNHGAEERRTRVRWRIDGREVSDGVVDVPAARAVEARFEGSLPERGIVSATIDDAGGYAADDVRYFVTDPPKPMPVSVVTGIDAPRDGAMFVLAALDAAGVDLRPFAVTTVSAKGGTLQNAAVLAAARVIIVLGTRGLDRPARAAISDAVREGRGLLVTAGPDVEPGVVRELLGEAGQIIPDQPESATGGGGLVATEARHPVLAALGETAGNLGQVRVDRAWSLRDAPGATTLIRYASGRPAVSEFALGRGRVFLVTTDLGRRWNTWPLHPTFVPFLVEAVQHLGGERTWSRDVLVGALPGADTSRPGVVTLPSTSERVAVNVDPRESRLDVVNAEDFTTRLQRVRSTGRPDPLRSDAEQGQALWRYGVFALLALLALEGAVAARPKAAVAPSPPEESARELSREGEAT